MLPFLQFLSTREGGGVRANVVFSAVSQLLAFEFTAGVVLLRVCCVCAQVNRSDKVAAGKVCSAFQDYLLWAASCESSGAQSTTFFYLRCVSLDQPVMGCSWAAVP